MELQDSDARPTNVAPGINNTDPRTADLRFGLTLPSPSKNVQTPQKNHKNLPLICLVLVLLLGVGGGLLWRKMQKDTKVTALTKVSVQLEWVNNPEFAGMYVAQDKGYYKEAGLSVNLKEFQDGTNVNKDVADGTVDYGVSTPMEVILARDKEENNKAIAAIYQTSPFSIVSQKSANIKTPADFSGKILGDSGNNDEAKVTYAVLMAHVGLKPTDAIIKPVDFDVSKVFKDDQAQTADIYRNDQTYVLAQAGIAYDQIFPEQYGFAIYGDVLIASDKTVAQKPAQTGAFVQATMKGWQYAIDHQAEALMILAKHDNVLYKDPDYAKFDLSGTLPLIKTTGNQPVGSMQFVPWNRAYQGVQDAGLLKDSFNVADLYTTEFVK